MLYLIFIFLMSLSVKTIFSIYFYLRLALYKPAAQVNTTDIEQPISLIVCYHNEEKNILSSLKYLQNQSYPNIELILVDDMSSDATFSLLLENKNKATVLLKNEAEHGGKKLALSNGIKASTTDWLLLTDADCTMSTDWANTMIHSAAKSKIVLGFAPLDKSKTVVGKFARYETYYTALQYLSFALAGMPYMGVGRNLLYHRNIFESAEGFSSHMDVSSGDDDLLINYAANKANTSICIDPKSFVYSPPKETLRSFFRQKARHVTSAHKYRWQDKLLLTFSSVAQMGLYISAGILLFSPQSEWLLGLIIYWLIMLIIQYPICKKLHSMDLWLLFPVYDIVMAIYYIVMIPFTFIKKQNTWS